jgi:hypothetical protein
MLIFEPPRASQNVSQRSKGLQTSAPPMKHARMARAARDGLRGAQIAFRDAAGLGGGQPKSLTKANFSFAVALSSNSAPIEQ